MEVLAIQSFNQQGYTTHGLANTLLGIARRHIEFFVLVALLAVYVFSLARQDVTTQHVLTTLQKSDFVYVDYLAINHDSDRQFRYIPMKVIEIDSKQVTFKVGNIAHSTPVSPRKHAKGDAAMRRNYYRVDTLTMSRTQLIDYYRSGVVYAARRPEQMFIDGWIVIPKEEIMENHTASVDAHCLKALSQTVMSPVVGCE